MDQYQEEIKQIELDIQKRESEIAHLKERLKVSKSSLRVCQEDEFERKYEKSAEKVRRDYVKYLDQCSHQGGEGYQVQVKGYGIQRTGAFRGIRISHWVLRPECREQCLPSKCVVDAFGIIGEEIEIAEHLHIERWGS